MIIFSNLVATSNNKLATTNMYNSKLNGLSSEILEASIKLHREMGTKQTISDYTTALFLELKKRGINSEQQLSLPKTKIRGRKNYITDLLVEKETLINIISTDLLLPEDEEEFATILKLSGKSQGFIINFKSPLLRNGFRRFVNSY